MSLVDYGHCKNVTGTESMCYNPYSRRSLVATTNSKRDNALETYRDIVATKSANLSWSNETPATLALVKPSGTTTDGDTRTDTMPYDQVLNPFVTITLNTTTPVGNTNIITPASIPIKPDGTGPHFKFTAANGTDAGYQVIKYTHNHAQLVEIVGEASLTLNSNSTERDVGMTIYKNGLMIDSALSQFIKVNMGTAGQHSQQAKLKIMTTLTLNDLISVALWRVDATSGSVNVDAYDVKLRVRTVI